METTTQTDKPLTHADRVGGFASTLPTDPRVPHNYVLRSYLVVF